MTKKSLFLGLFLTGVLVGALPVSVAQTTVKEGGGAATVPASAPVGGRGGGRRQVILMPEGTEAANPRIDQNWAGRHMALVARAKQGGVDLYMLGDSITDFWGNGTAHRANWDKYLGGWKAGNFGITADRVEHVLFRIRNGELDGVKPKVIVLLIGTNNFNNGLLGYAANTPEEVAAGIKTVLGVLREKQPQAKILLMGLFPREDIPNQNPAPKIKALNGMIAKFADGKQIKFLDVYDQLVDKEGKLLPGMFEADKIHPADGGYDVWGTAMKPILTEWLGEGAAGK